MSLREVKDGEHIDEVWCLMVWYKCVQYLIYVEFMNPTPSVRPGYAVQTK